MAVMTHLKRAKIFHENKFFSYYEPLCSSILQNEFKFKLPNLHSVRRIFRRHIEGKMAPLIRLTTLPTTKLSCTCKE